MASLIAERGRREGQGPGGGSSGPGAHPDTAPAKEIRKNHRCRHPARFPSSPPRGPALGPPLPALRPGPARRLPPPRCPRPRRARRAECEPRESQGKAGQDRGREHGAGPRRQRAGTCGLAASPGGQPPSVPVQFRCVRPAPRAGAVFVYREFPSWRRAGWERREEAAAFPHGERDSVIPEEIGRVKRSEQSGVVSFSLLGKNE